jgi:tetratricopeptide (TPR) repeat protein
MSRLEQLRRLAAAQPGDPFTHYGVGLEYMQLERWDDALAAFEQTLSIDPQYSAAYFQKARTELKLGRRAEAAETLKAGMAVAAARGETHTVSKMQEMLESLA